MEKLSQVSQLHDFLSGHKNTICALKKGGGMKSKEGVCSLPYEAYSMMMLEAMKWDQQDFLVHSEMHLYGVISICNI